MNNIEENRDCLLRIAETLEGNDQRVFVSAIPLLEDFEYWRKYHFLGGSIRRRRQLELMYKDTDKLFSTCFYYSKESDAPKTCLEMAGYSLDIHGQEFPEYISRAMIYQTQENKAFDSTRAKRAVERMKALKRAEQEPKPTALPLGCVEVEETTIPVIPIWVIIIIVLLAFFFS